MPDKSVQRSRLRLRARPAGVAALAATHVFFAWFAPAWLAPLVLAWVALAVWHPRVRAAFSPRVLLAITGLLACFALKDLVLPGPFAAELARLDPAVAPPRARQPDWPAQLVSLGRLAAILLALPALRALLAPPRLARAAVLGLALPLLALAFALLTHPARAADYGRGFQLGEVASRNPAAGAFALGALLAFGAGLSALRAGRREALPTLASAGVCAVAVAALGSRGALLALAAGAAALLYFENKYKPARFIALGAGLVVLLLFLAPGPLARLAAEGETYRLELAAASLRALARAPWGGLGLGGFSPGFALFGGLMPAEGMKVIHPDCGWVLPLVEWGALGLLAFVFTGRTLLRPAAPAETESPRLIAAAGLVAWAAAAVADISFHRAEILVLGLPLLALRFPSPEDETAAARPSRLAPLWVGALALAACSVVLWCESRVRAARDPVRFDAALAASFPLDPAVRHLAGNRALERGDLPRAAAEYTVAAALDPANTEAMQAYARALAGQPELALPLWRRLFAGATLRAHALLADELERPGAHDASYWLRALPDSPALWILPADTGLRGAQPAYERWLRSPAGQRAASPWKAALGATARWGTAREFEAWLRESPPASSAGAVAEGGQLLRNRNRDDLAWLWLDHHFPAPPITRRPRDPALAAIVLGNPEDTVSAARLLDQTDSAAERIALLERLVARPAAPPSFRVRLAHEFDAAGRRREALAMLQHAAADLARSDQGIPPPASASR